jgi:transposase
MSDSEYEELIRLRQQTVEQQQSMAKLQKQLEASNRANAEQHKLLTNLQDKFDILITQMKKRNQRDFGSTTERHNPKPALATQDTATLLRTKPKREPKPRNHVKHILTQNLPTEPVPHHVKPEYLMCPDCDIETDFVRNEITYQLERLTHTLKRLQHEQEVRACSKCKKYIVTAEKPCPPIPGSYAGPGLLADIVTSKLADALPNHRQEKRFKREAAIIPRSTQCDWMLAISFTTEPLYELLKHQILLSKITQTDDTEIKIQDRKHKRKMRKGKMTVYRGDRQHPFVAFDFSPTQSFERNIAFLKSYAGIVQADAANGFDALFKDGTKTEAGCNAHSRRRYYEALFLDPKGCSEVLDVYHKIYGIEAEIRTASPEHRLAVRRRKIKPLVKELRKKVVALQNSLNPSNPVMKAVEYTLAHWIALTRFLKDPDIDVDNNACEREIKDFVLDRKNFLFAGSDAGGKAIAILLSLISSAKRNNVEPREYLTDVFSRINSMKTSELEQLLPDRWAKARDQNTAS